MSLVTFAAARQRARLLADLTSAGTMPPWQPEPGGVRFEGERHLSLAEIGVFRQWLDDGMREGEPRDLPPVPPFSSGWTLGEPDLVLTMPSYQLGGDGPDRFRNFVVPVPVGVLRYVRAWEFRPGNAKAVHHATMQIDSTLRSRQYDERDKEAGYEGLIAPSARAPDGFFLDWAPGHRPQKAPDGVAWPLPPASALVMMLHLRPTGKEETVQASVALYFSPTPPVRIPVMIRLTRQDLDFAPGDAAASVTATYRLPVDVDLYSVQPHAHYLARQMRARATLPGGRTVSLITIEHWNLDWQDVYHYASPLFLPAGSTISMDYTYDNSAANLRNPHTPPVRVTYGQQTSDEMAELWFQAVAREPGARGVLASSVAVSVLPQEISGRRMMLKQDPGNVSLHDDLALLLADANHMAEAVDEFTASLRLQPSSAAAAFNVGAALLAMRRFEAARPYFERAIALAPDHARAHSDLAVVLQSSGAFVEAVRLHQRALQLDNGDPDILLSAGVGFEIAGLHQEAVVQLRQALEARPDWPNAQAALASTLTAGPEVSASDRLLAVDLAERAVAATGGRNAAFQDILLSARQALDRR